MGHRLTRHGADPVPGPAAHLLPRLGLQLGRRLLGLSHVRARVRAEDRRVHAEHDGGAWAQDSHCQGLLGRGRKAQSPQLWATLQLSRVQAQQRPGPGPHARCHGDKLVPNQPGFGPATSQEKLSHRRPARTRASADTSPTGGSLNRHLGLKDARPRRGRPSSPEEQGPTTHRVAWPGPTCTKEPRTPCLL